MLAILKLLVKPTRPSKPGASSQNVLAGVGQTSLEKMFRSLDEAEGAEQEVKVSGTTKLREAADKLTGRAKTSMMRLVNFIDNYGAEGRKAWPDRGDDTVWR